MSASFFFVEDVDLGLELRMGGYRSGFCEDLAAFHLVLFDASSRTPMLSPAWP